MKTTFKKSIGAMLTALLLFSLVVPASAATVGITPLIVGVGTEQHPIEITTAEQLAEIAAKVNAGDMFFNSAYYKLANDIDLSGYAIWTPIGISGKTFNGSFDGGGFVIRNLKITSGTYSGLFGYMEGATIKNLGVINVNISSNSHVGGVAAYGKGTITNCYTTGVVTTTGGFGAGGVVGYLTGGIVSNCYSTATVTSSVASAYTGGVVGANSASTVSYCYATGIVSGNSSNGTGGVVGRNNGPSSYCVGLNQKIVSSNAARGRIVGNNSSLITNSYAFSGMTVNGSTVSSADPASINGANITAADIIAATAFWTTAGWSSNANWTIGANKLPVLVGVGGQDGVIPGHIGGTGYAFAGGDGTSAGTAYQINTAEQLAQLAALVNANNIDYNAKFYKLTADIDLAGYSNWTPIGISTNTFKGNFDGGGFVVKNLTLNATGNYHGLFGYAFGATIKNLGVINVNIKGGNYVGAVVGCMSDVGKITNCYVTGTVRGGELVGGIAGYVYGTHATTAVEMANCFSAATVSGTNEVGGVAGRLYFNGTTTSAKMSYCYAIGAVSGTDKIGGVVGLVGDTNVTLSNCIALNPSVTGTTNVGRVVGSGTTGLSKLYAYTNTLVNGSAVGAGSATTKDGSAHGVGNISDKTVWNSTYANFTTAWTIADNNLPILKTTDGAEIRGQDSAIPVHINASGSPFAGAGTQPSPYQISTAAQLAQLATFVNANNATYNAATVYYKLMNDIDLSGYSNWTPIGNSGSKFFSSNFDGNGYVVKNLTINDSSNDFKALFGYTVGASIKNLGVVHVNIRGKQYVGGLGGYVGNSSTVQNCYTTGTINGSSDVGGMVGLLYMSSITNCYSTSTASGTTGIGGVGGTINNSGTVKNCVALNPSVTGSSKGRVVGNSIGTRTNNYGFSGMTGGTSSTDKTSQHGADITGAQAMTASFWSTAANWNSVAWDTSVWTIESGKLPILKGVGSDQTGDAGVYLGLTEWSSYANSSGITGGGSTADDPYIITTAAQLAYVAQQVNSGNLYSGKFLKLAGDIDIGAHLWVPIGTTSANSFKGTFDGNGKTISGLTINGSYLGVGLFGYTSNATLKNIGVNVTAFNNTYKTSVSHNGGLVGGSDGSTAINDCYVTGGTINADVHSGAVIGGLVGYTNSTATITNCYVTNLITAPGVTAVGGLIGNHVNSGAATYSYWNGSITNGKGAGNAFGTGCAGKSTADMQLGAFATLLNTNKADATINWKIVPGKNNGYPIIINGDSESEMKTVINDTTTTDSGFSVQQSNLDEVIENVVTPEDKSGGKTITLSLNVSDVGGENSETEAIKAAAGKVSEVYFFDVSLIKSVDDDGSVTDEPLTNIPVPLEIHIKLSDGLAGKSYYKVYRYHNAVAEQISNDTSKTEHYVVDVAASEIIIYTMKFSTYAIFGNDYTLGFDEGYDVDVQAKITGEDGSVYKIDIAWGAMIFAYSTSGVWDPDTHSYDEESTVGWLQEGFASGNNKITAYNHSNGDVLVSFGVVPELGGVDMTVKQINSANNNTMAINMPLGKVPFETADAPSIDAYLWLDGKPDDPKYVGRHCIYQNRGNHGNDRSNGRRTNAEKIVGRKAQ